MSVLLYVMGTLPCSICGKGLSFESESNKLIYRVDIKQTFLDYRFYFEKLSAVLNK